MFQDWEAFGIRFSGRIRYRSTETSHVLGIRIDADQQSPKHSPTFEQRHASNFANLWVQ